MSEFKVGQRVRVAEGATWGWGRPFEVRSALIGETVTIEAGPDADNDYIVENEDGVDDYVGGEFLTLVEEEEGQPQVGARYRVAVDSLDWVGLPEGTEVTVAGSTEVIRHHSQWSPQHFLVTDEHERAAEMTAEDWNGNGTAWVTLDEVTPVEAEEPQTGDFQPGDRVLVIDDGGGNPVEVGEYGTVVEVDNYVLTTGQRLIYVKWDKGNQCGLFDCRLEKVEEQNNDTGDDGPALDLSGLSGLSATLVYMDETVDAVNHPPHYGGFSNGAEVIDITEHLTFNGGNAVKYVARSTRKDGKNKGNVLEDLRKARWYIDREIERIESQ